LSDDRIVPKNPVNATRISHLSDDRIVPKNPVNATRISPQMAKGNNKLINSSQGKFRSALLEV